MATVYLARRVGAGGFMKWVAIKRVHPHLAKRRKFVSMFLDESRIAATLQHSNVAQVFELGSDKDEPFLVMEYLHGENFGSVWVASLEDGKPLPPELSAYVIRAAALGLHHAHGAVGPDGAPLHIVHRDVSPQNIFVTYDGMVKVTDFGIAMAQGRIVETRTGAGVKGKFAYMAPEQALGRTVDRRADLFALGIILWEASVGRRLFRAATEAKTIMRLTSGRVPKPSSIVGEYPHELERIVLKALAVRPADRYASAAELAEDLDRFIAGKFSAPDLARWMQSMFAERVRIKEAVLRSNVDPATFPLAIAEPEQTELTAPGERSSKLRRTAIAAALIATLGLFLYFGLFRGSGVLRIESTPPGAVVFLDGVQQLQTTPILIEDVERGEHDLRFELAGFSTHQRRFELQAARGQIHVELAQQAATAPVVAFEEPSLDQHITDHDSRRSNSAGHESAADSPAPSEAESRAANQPTADESQGERIADEQPDLANATSTSSRRRHRSMRAVTSGRAHLNLMATPVSARVRINGRCHWSVRD